MNEARARHGVAWSPGEVVAQGSSLEAGSSGHHTAGGTGRGEKVLLTRDGEAHTASQGSGTSEHGSWIL